MTSLAEIREAYPEYANRSDRELLEGFHRRFYSQVDFNDFVGRIEGGQRAILGSVRPQPRPNSDGASRQIVPPRAMPQNAELDTFGPGAGGGMRDLTDRGILPRRYRQAETDQAQPSTGEMSVGEDVARSGGSGLVRGTVNFLDTPGFLAQGGANAIEAIFRHAFDGDAPQWTQQIAEGMRGGAFSGNAARGGVEAVPGGEAAMNYEPRTTPGEYAQTGAEFIPGAVALGGPAAAIPFGLVPGLTSEFAGQMTEGMTVPEGVPLVGGMDVEPAARFAGAMVGPMLYNAAARAITPNPADPARTAAAARLRAEGVQTTAGQRTGNRDVRIRETAAGRTADVLDQQLDDFTEAALRRVGLTDDVAREIRSANPEVIPTRANDTTLNTLLTRIGNQFNRLTRRNQILPDDDLRLGAQQTAQTYADQATGETPGILRTLTDRLSQRSEPISGSMYQDWRSRVSRLTRSQDPAVRDAAIDMVNLLDDAMARSMRAAGRPEDFAAFQQARTQYRDFLIIERAATASGETSALGILTPSQLYNAARNVAGRRSMATGRSDIGRLAEAGNTVLLRPPTSNTPQQQSALGMLAGGSTTGVGSGLAASALGASDPYAVGIGLATALAPQARTAFTGSRAGQAYLGNQLFTGGASMSNPANLNVLAQALREYENSREGERAR
jgi:hypothetical protein